MLAGAMPRQVWVGLQPAGVILLALCCHAVASAQAGAGEPANIDVPRVHLSVSYRLSPPVSEPLLLASTLLFRSGARGETIARRVLTDSARRQVYAYEVVLEPQGAPDRYLVSFRNIDAQAVELPANDWALQSPAAYPPPRVWSEGETVSVDLGTILLIGRPEVHIVDNVSLAPIQHAVRIFLALHALGRPMGYGGLLKCELAQCGLLQRGFTPPGATAQSPSSGPPPISGSPRGFRAGDAELHALAWTITRNGSPAGATPRAAAHGRLLYLYLPGNGRYIFSLVPQPELGFIRAGQVSGNLLQWTSDGDTFRVESTAPIIATGGPFYIYMLHDPDWQPVTATRRDLPSVGSVDPEEIRLLQMGEK
jgi:hypothetical protein